MACATSGGAGAEDPGNVVALAKGAGRFSAPVPLASASGGATMPPEMMILAASSMLMLRKITSAFGTKQMNPVGGTMPVGMKTVKSS